MVYFIVISILVHIFTIFALLVLYQRGTVAGTHLAYPTEDVARIQQSMQSFITEIESENEAFYEKINHLFAEKLLHMENKINELDKKIVGLESMFAAEEAEKLETSGISPENTQPEATMDTSLPQMGQVMDLYRQGFNVEQISKALQIGKGEVSLMLNILNKQGLKK